MIVFEVTTYRSVVIYSSNNHKSVFYIKVYRVRNSWGRVSNLPLLLAEEGSQITTFGGRRVPNFTFLTQNFWREKGLKSQQIGGRRVSNEDFTPLKVAV